MSLALPQPPELEFDEEEYTVDMAFPEAKVVIEADGPLHFMRNTAIATGRTAGQFGDVIQKIDRPNTAVVGLFAA